MHESRHSVIADYIGALDGDSEEHGFLQSIPWVIDAGRQDPEHLARGLKFEASRFPELPRQITFSVITPLWNTPPPLLEELILSIRCQSWPRWELILVDDASTERYHLSIAETWAGRESRIRLIRRSANGGISAARNDGLRHASGDFITFVDHDDLIHPSALGVFARHLNMSPDVNLVFSNEAKIDEHSRRISGFLAKPPFDLFTLLRVNYVCHLTAIERGVLLTAAEGGRVFREEYDGVEDHELLLRLAMTGKLNARHVPLFLYYWRTTPASTASSPTAKDGLREKRLKMLAEYVPRFYPSVSWSAELPGRIKGQAHTSLSFDAIRDATTARLLVIIPFRDQIDLTIRCLESLERQAHRLDVHAILINNRAENPETMPALMRWLAEPRRNRYTVIHDGGPFHYARMNNSAVREHGKDADLLLFLNNDVELVSSDCLQAMAGLLRAEPLSGFVGIRLMYPDRQEVQHGGVKVFEHLIGSGYNVVDHARTSKDFVFDEHIVFGVTFACAMTRRQVFEELDGLEEVLLPNVFGDVDMCARSIEAGYRNYYLGTRVGLHHESKTRGRASEEAEFVFLNERHAGTFAEWRLRNLSYSHEHTWPIPNPPVVYVPSPPPSVPLRHKVADRLNVGLKFALGPVHRVLKSCVITVATWRRRKRGRAVHFGAGGEPSNDLSPAPESRTAA